MESNPKISFDAFNKFKNSDIFKEVAVILISTVLTYWIVLQKIGDHLFIFSVLLLAFCSIGYNRLRYLRYRKSFEISKDLLNELLTPEAARASLKNLAEQVKTTGEQRASLAKLSNETAYLEKAEEEKVALQNFIFRSKLYRDMLTNYGENQGWIADRVDAYLDKNSP
jgi:hypothetical protein